MQFLAKGAEEGNDPRLPCPIAACFAHGDARCGRQVLREHAKSPLITTAHEELCQRALGTAT